MPILEALRELMADSVTVEPRTGKNVNDEPTYSAAVSYVCRVEGEIKHVTDPMGNERVSTVQVYLDRYVSAMTPRDRVTLPSHWTPRQPPIVTVRHHGDEDGLIGEMSHTVIFC